MFLNILPIGSMHGIYMVTWTPPIYPLYVSIYTSTWILYGLVYYNNSLT